MTEQDAVTAVKNMTMWGQQKVYSTYLASCLYLKYYFEVVDKEPILKHRSKENINLKWNHGWGKPDKEFLGIAFYYPGKGKVKIKSFLEFISEENIVIVNNGDNWKESGYASRSWVTLSTESIYHYVYHNIN